MDANEEKKKEFNSNMEDDIDISKLEQELEDKISDWDFIEKETEQIGNPDALGETLVNVVWDQFLNQIAVKAGEDFIKENHGLTLDLRKEAHIQTTENFSKGKIATHNTKIDYQERYDDYMSNFVKDENGNVVMHETRTGKQEPTLVKGARKPFDEGRPKGSTKRHTDMDHTVPTAEIIRDPRYNAHLTKEEQIAFANSKKNLNEIDSSWNRSKGDKSTSDWLDNPNSKGKKPDEIFDMTEEDKCKLRRQDKKAREELEKLAEKGEERSIAAGKKSQKEEAFRIGGKALRAVIMQLLAELIKEIISKLVRWLKEKKKTMESLIESVKDAIRSFVGKMKEHMINATSELIITIAKAISEPVVQIIQGVGMILKQGWQVLKGAVAYLKNPENKDVPNSIKLLEIGKIVMAGLSGIGGVALGESIGIGLRAIPMFNIEIPLIGSLANMVGIFMGTLVAGIVGAIAINLLDKATAQRRREIALENKIEKGNEVLAVQRKVRDATMDKTNRRIADAVNDIEKRHEEATKFIKESVDEIFDDSENYDNQIDFDEIDSALDDLLD